MKRYHFKTSGQSDVQGVELADVAGVKREAAKVAASMVFAAADKVWRNSEWAMSVTDDFGTKILELRIIGSEAA